VSAVFGGDAVPRGGDDRPGEDGVDAYRRPVLNRELPRQRSDPALRSGIRRVARDARKGVYGRDIDDAALARDEIGVTRTKAEIDARQARVELLSPLVGGELVCGRDLPAGGVRVTASAFQSAIAESAALRAIFLRYAQSYLSQVSQSSACNRAHSIEERCARWLLMTHDRVTADEFPLTQEFLSFMLGVRRAGVSIAAAMLQKAGFIEYRHGRIKVVDREGLEGASCACYRIIRDTYDNSLRPRR